MKEMQSSTKTRRTKKRNQLNPSTSARAWFRRVALINFFDIGLCFEIGGGFPRII